MRAQLATMLPLVLLLLLLVVVLLLSVVESPLAKQRTDGGRHGDNVGDHHLAPVVAVVHITRCRR